MTEGIPSTGFAIYADYRNRFFHLSMNERRETGVKGETG